MQSQHKVYLPNKEEGAVILSWFTAPNKDIYEGLPLAVYRYNSSQEQHTFTSPNEGTVESLHPVGVPLDAGQPVMLISMCSHDVQFHQMCGICGKDLSLQHFSKTTPNQTNLTLIHSQPELKFSRQEAEKDAHATAKRLFANKKLSLVLDLDQTLVHATTDPRVESLFAGKIKAEDTGAATEKPTNNAVGDPLEGLHRFQLPGPPKANVFFIKERPRLREFLEEANKMFELHIYTMGTRKYAEEVARIIDPQHVLFRENIVSRDDTASVDYKSIQRIFPCDDSMVIIIDDRIDVWGGCKNLIRIEPYLFFHDTKVNALPRDALPPPGGPKPPTQEQDKERKRKRAIEVDTKTQPEATQPGEKAEKPVAGATEQAAEPSVKKQKVDENSKQADTAMETEATTPPADNALLSQQQPQQQQPFLPYIPAAMDDRQLLHVLRLLKEVHQMFYSGDGSEKEKEKEKETRETAPQRVEDEPIWAAEKMVVEALDKEFAQKVQAAEVGTDTGGDDKGKGKEKETEKPKEQELTNAGGLKGSAARRRKRTKEDEDEDELFWNEEKGMHLVKEVKYCLYLARKRVLKGVHILFSGIFPLNTAPENTTLWMVAEAFGAVCHAYPMPQITHLVAVKGGTEKVKQAAATPLIKIVHVNWLLDSFRHYMREDESKYPLPEGPVATSHGKGIEGGGLSSRDLHFVQMLHTAYVTGLRELVDRCEKKKMREYRALRRSLSGSSLLTGEAASVKQQEAAMDEFLLNVLGKGDDEDDEEGEEDEDEEEDYGSSDSDSGWDSDSGDNKNSNDSSDGGGAVDAEDEDFSKQLEAELDDW